MWDKVKCKTRIDDEIVFDFSESLLSLINETVNLSPVCFDGLIQLEQCHSSLAGNVAKKFASRVPTKSKSLSQHISDGRFSGSLMPRKRYDHIRNAKKIRTYRIRPRLFRKSETPNAIVVYRLLYCLGRLRADMLQH